MQPVPSPRRRPAPTVRPPRAAPRGRCRLALVAGIASAVALSPAVASAAKVRGPGPWQASNTYLVRADLDGRSAPRTNAVVRVNHVRAGQWIRITCQTTGQRAYGSNVWIKTGGLYVPDHYVKTYTDGLLSGVPRCGGAPTPQPRPAGPSQATLAAAISTVTYERVYGSQYRLQKAAFPRRSYPSGPGIIWKNNGCSVPAKLVDLELGGGRIPKGKPVAFYAGIFEKSCDRHDFGYRNYGTDSGGRALDPTEARRASIDSRFLSNMDHQCRKVFSRKYVEAIQRGACYKAADVFKLAVSKRGQPNFF